MQDLGLKLKLRMVANGFSTRVRDHSPLKLKAHWFAPTIRDQSAEQPNSNSDLKHFNGNYVKAKFTTLSITKFKKGGKR